MSSILSPSLTSLDHQDAAGASLAPSLPFLAYNRNDLESWLASIDEKTSHAARLMGHYYQKHESPSQCPHISERLRCQLKQHFSFDLPTIHQVQDSHDGTRKWLFRLHDLHTIETVFIPEAQRGTLCISSQVGCAMACQFCATGKQGFHRHLSTAEILAQVVMATRYNQEYPLTEPSDQPSSLCSKITNVVFMGMGEPLLNEEAVYRAVEVLLDDHGFGLSQYRVTVSTVGIVPALARYSQRCRAALAVSLHAANDPLRSQIVPINDKFNLGALLQACRNYQRQHPQRSITFEYILLGDVNDSPEHAQQLGQCLQGLRAKINLIPFNAVEGLGYRPATLDAIAKFSAILKDQGWVVTLRKQRGDDIAAACGQLSQLAHHGRQRTPYAPAPSTHLTGDSNRVPE